MKIRTRLTLTFSAAFFILVFLTSAVISWNTYLTLKQDLVNNLNTLSYLRTSAVKAYFSGKSDFATSLAASSVFRDFLKEASGSANYEKTKNIAKQRLVRTLDSAQNEGINEVFLISVSGRVVASSDNAQEGQDKNKDPYFTEARVTAYLRGIYMSQVTNRLSYAVSAPIKDDQSGKLLGVVVTRYDTNRFFKLLMDTRGLGNTGETFLVNKDRFFITPPRFLGESAVLNKQAVTANTDNCFNPREMATVTANPDASDATIHHGHDPVAFFSDYRNISVIGTHNYIPDTAWCLVTKVDQAEFFSPLLRILSYYVGFMLVGLGLFVVLSIVVSQRITKPLELLQKGSEEIAKGKLDHKVGINSKDEIGQLSQVFDQMVAAIKKSRKEVDQKVLEQTSEIIKRSADMDAQRKAILNILEDVEEEKNRVTLEKDKIDAILHSIGDGVFVVDKERRLILLNDVAGNLCGCEKFLDAIGRPYTDLFKFVFEDRRDTVNDSFVIDAIATGLPKEMSNHTLLIRHDGTSIAVADSAAPLKDKKGNVTGCVVVFRDVTKEREVDRMKTEFISLASHQLRTPLSAMKWFAEMLLNGDSGELTPEQKDFVNNIYQSNERMISLVNSLLNISRIESGRIVIDPKPSDLSELINDISLELKHTLLERNQNLVVSIHPDLPKINIDPKMIREVYKNLLTNAIKYSPKGTDIMVFISRKDTDLISQVSDSGFGIPVSEQGRVFSKFYRGTNIVKMETDGTGLGLYLVKSVVESSGGKIWFSSKEGEGTSFWFSLPISGSIAKTGEVTLNS